jgi:hypothetical protein
MPIRRKPFLVRTGDHSHMPTASTSSTATKASAKRKPAKRVSAQSKAKAQRTRTVHQAESTVKQAQTATRETAGALGDYAERAVLIPVGAALIARDRVVDSVSETLATYSSPSKTQAQLRRFERRGATARSRLEREVRKARVRAERQLRQRRRSIESTLSEVEERVRKSFPRPA